MSYRWTTSQYQPRRSEGTARATMSIALGAIASSAPNMIAQLATGSGDSWEKIERSMIQGSVDVAEAGRRVGAPLFRDFVADAPHHDRGMIAVAQHRGAVPVVAVAVYYDVGMRSEPEGRTGFAHLFEHMLFSGSQHVGNNEHFRHIQSVGGVLNAFTGKESTCYYAKVLCEHLPLALLQRQQGSSQRL